MKYLNLYKHFTKEIVSVMVKMMETKQSPKWHPEGDCWIHTVIVVDRLSIYNDINLTLAGLFHDMGKINTTKINPKTGDYHAPAHEIKSLDYLFKFSDWVHKMGGDYELIRYIIKNHMRVKFINEMSKKTLINFTNHAYFEYLLKFDTADYGGSEKKCKKIKKIPKIRKRINFKSINILKKFYIRGVFILPFNKYFIITNKKPFLVEVKRGINKGNKCEIRL